jgi:sortase A
LKSQLAPTVIATLELPTQDTRIPVFTGTSEASMTLGAGHLSDSSPLSGNGNIALTAHRDGSFRVLKDLAIGDPVILKTGTLERHFVITSQMVVAPDRVDVLGETSVPTLTLITCYPFHYLGSAPDRYVVHAELLNAEPTEAAAFSGELALVITEPDPISLDK